MKGGWGDVGGQKRRGEGIIYTNKICTYFVIQVATGPCTTVKPEADYQGAALQHLLHKVKKLKTQKQSCICVLKEISVSFCNITNCVGNVTDLRVPISAYIKQYYTY